MTATFTSRQHFPVPVDTLLQAHVDPRFQEQKMLALGATSARASRSTEADGTIVVEISSTEPARWGKEDANTGTMTYRIDPAARRGTWSRVQKGFEKKARAEGTISFSAAGQSRSQVVVEGSIDVKVPIIGKLIERKIVAAIAERESNEESIATALLLKRTDPPSP